MNRIAATLELLFEGNMKKFSVFSGALASPNYHFCYDQNGTSKWARSLG